MLRLSHLISSLTAWERHVLTCLLLGTSFLVGGFVADYLPALSRDEADTGSVTPASRPLGQALVSVNSSRK